MTAPTAPDAGATTDSGSNRVRFPWMREFDPKASPDKTLGEWGGDPRKLTGMELLYMAKNAPDVQARAKDGSGDPAELAANAWLYAAPDVNGKTRFLPLNGNKLDDKIIEWDKKLQDVNAASVAVRPEEVKYHSAFLTGTGPNVSDLQGAQVEVDKFTKDISDTLAELEALYGSDKQTTGLKTLCEDRKPKVQEWAKALAGDNGKLKTAVTDSGKGAQETFTAFHATVDKYREDVAKMIAMGDALESRGKGSPWGTDGVSPWANSDPITTELSSAETAGDQRDPKAAVAAGMQKVEDAAKPVSGLWAAKPNVSQANVTGLTGGTGTTAGIDKSTGGGNGGGGNGGGGNGGGGGGGGAKPTTTSPATTTSGGKSGPDEGKVEEIVDKIMNAAQQPAQQAAAQQPAQQAAAQMPTGTGTGTSPFDGLGKLATALSGEAGPALEQARDSLAAKPDDTAARRTSPEARQGDAMLAPASVVRPGDAVRPGQIGADMRLLDKDGDGKMDADAVAPTKEAMDKDGDGKPDEVPTAVVIDGKMHPVKIDDPRLLEMMNTLGAANGKDIDVLEAAKRAGMPLSSYGELLDDPLTAKTGDVVTGSQGTGMYLGDGKVLMENGSVKQLGEVLELRPPHSGIFRLDLPDLPSADGGKPGEGGAPAAAPAGDEGKPGQGAAAAAPAAAGEQPATAPSAGEPGAGQATAQPVEQKVANPPAAPAVDTTSGGADAAAPAKPAPGQDQQQGQGAPGGGTPPAGAQPPAGAPPAGSTAPGPPSPMIRHIDPGDTPQSW